MPSIEAAINASPKTARSENFDLVLAMLYEIYKEEPINIVETGTIRNSTNQGDGWSTVVWQSYNQQFGGHIWTCDISEKNIEICRAVTQDIETSYVVEDSVKFLKEFKQVIHFLYLDSYDTEEGSKEASIHQLNEIKNAIDKLDKRALVMLDDVPEDGKGGKGELSIPFLVANNFQILYYKNNQMILGRYNA